MKLYERVKKRLPRISLATVYRNLEILTKVGLIAKREVSGRQKRFDYDVTDHDHIFCIQCHRIDNLDLKQGGGWKSAGGEGLMAIPLQDTGWNLPGYAGIADRKMNKKRRRNNGMRMCMQFKDIDGRTEKSP